MTFPENERYQKRVADYQFDEQNMTLCTYKTTYNRLCWFGRKNKGLYFYHDKTAIILQVSNDPVAFHMMRLVP